MLTPHLININPGEDVFWEIMLFCLQSPRATCILSAVGDISTVALSQAGSSVRTVTYEGLFQIMSLSGGFWPLSGSCSMSILFASPDGSIAGGTLAGMMVAASPVRVIVGSFAP